MSENLKKNLTLVFKIIISIILLQTLYFKFTGQIESKYIFSKLMAEPYGRFATGIIELFASIFLFIPTLQFLGLGMILGSMFGALTSHIFVLGLAIKGNFEGQTVQDDHGILFTLLLVILFSSFVIISLNFYDFIEYIKKVPLIKKIIVNFKKDVKKD